MSSCPKSFIFCSANLSAAPLIRGNARSGRRRLQKGTFGNIGSTISLYSPRGEVALHASQSSCARLGPEAGIVELEQLSSLCHGKAWTGAGQQSAKGRDAAAAHCITKLATP